MTLPRSPAPSGASLLATTLGVGMLVSVGPADTLFAPAVAASACQIPAETAPFVSRLFAHLPTAGDDDFQFQSWSHPGRPAMETVGIHTFPAVDPERVVAALFDVESRTRTHEHVLVSRAIPDARFKPPAAVRYYQLIDLSVLGKLQIASVLNDSGTCHGYRLVSWSQLGPETEALSPADGIRNAYSDGAWLISSTRIGYGISSAPRADDTNPIQEAALITGGDLAARGMIEANIRAMYRSGAAR